jgi:enoyl-CoA hydratase
VSVLLETDRGAVRWLTMNRPEVRNAQDTALIDALSGALARADDDDTVRVVVLAGSGDHWSAGHDLKALVGEAEADRWRQMRATPEGKLRHEQVMYVDRCLELYHFRKPTVAAVQGACIAAGLMLAAMCDLIVAADDAFFSNPVLRMSGAGVELLVEPWELGIRKAKEFLFTGDTIDAQEAWRLGLANRVVPRARLEEEVQTLAERVALVPPITAQMVKASINQSAALAGKENSWRHHFMVHHFTHNTATAMRMLEERETRRSMKEVLADRDRGDMPPSEAGEESPTPRGADGAPTVPVLDRHVP